MTIDLRQGDCLDLMRQTQDCSIDLTVTSPPYDNLRTYNGNISQWNFEKFQAIADELYRITKQGGVVVWIVADATIKGSETGTSFRQALYFKEIGFNLHDTMIWKKPDLTYPEVNRYYPSFEYMFVFSRGKPQHYELIADKPNKFAGAINHGTDRKPDGTVKKQCGNGKRKVKETGIRQNVWEIPGVKSNKERTGHPAQFPERLAHDHIVSWSNEGDTILDPFMGSGTTGVACINTNRNFIGMELDEQYFKIAKERISNAQSKQSKQTSETECVTSTEKTRSQWLDDLLGGD